MTNKKTILLLGVVGLGALLLINSKKNNEPVFSPNSNSINPIVPSSGFKVSFDSPTQTPTSYSIPSYSEFLNATAPIITTQNAPTTPTKKETTTEKLLSEGYEAIGEAKGEVFPIKNFNEGVKLIGELGGGKIIDIRTGGGMSVAASTKKEETKTQKGITYTPTLSYEKAISTKGGLSDMVRDVTNANISLKTKKSKLPISPYASYPTQPKIILPISPYASYATRRWF